MTEPILRCVPGALVVRDNDKHIGVIVAADTPAWDPELNQVSSWHFRILIDDRLITTYMVGGHFSLVQTWD